MSTNDTLRGFVLRAHYETVTRHDKLRALAREHRGDRHKQGSKEVYAAPTAHPSPAGRRPRLPSQCCVAATCIDRATSACSSPNKADSTPCDDGNSDTAGDACTGGVCAGIDHCIGVVCVIATEGSAVAEVGALAALLGRDLPDVLGRILRSLRSVEHVASHVMGGGPAVERDRVPADLAAEIGGREDDADQRAAAARHAGRLPPGEGSILRFSMPTKRVAFGKLESTTG